MAEDIEHEYWCTPTNGTVTAKISSSGNLTWTASGTLKALVVGDGHVQHGKCNEL